jgi:hypothetical protein
MWGVAWIIRSVDGRWSTRARIAALARLSSLPLRTFHPPLDPLQPPPMSTAARATSSRRAWRVQDSVGDDEIHDEKVLEPTYGNVADAYAGLTPVGLARAFAGAVARAVRTYDRDHGTHAVGIWGKGRRGMFDALWAGPGETEDRREQVWDEKALIVEEDEREAGVEAPWMPGSFADEPSRAAFPQLGDSVATITKSQRGGAFHYFSIHVISA